MYFNCKQIYITFILIFKLNYRVGRRQDVASSSGVMGPCRGHCVEAGSSVDGPQHGWGCVLCRGRRVSGGLSVGSPWHVQCVGWVRVVACGGCGYG